MNVEPKHILLKNPSNDYCSNLRSRSRNAFFSGPKLKTHIYGPWLVMLAGTMRQMHLPFALGFWCKLPTTGESPTNTSFLSRPCIWAGHFVWKGWNATILHATLFYCQLQIPHTFSSGKTCKTHSIGTVASLTLHVAFARDHMGGWCARVLVTPRQGAGAEIGSDDWDEFHSLFLSLIYTLVL